jgi:hypothetical protein
MQAPQVKLTLTPDPVMRVFHERQVVVDCGRPEDIEATACAAYLMWQVEYPGYAASLTVDGWPEAANALNAALFA